MAQVILNNETYIAATSGVQIFGSDGNEHVTVLAGVTGLQIASSIETVKFDGHLSDYKFSGTGGQLNVFSQGTMIAQISGAESGQIVFSDGAFDVDYRPEEFALTIEGQEIPNIDLSDPTASVVPAPVVRQFGWIDENTYISGADKGYNIKFTVLNAPNESLKQGIANAAERISDIVVGDLPEMSGIDDIEVEVSFGTFTNFLGFGAYRGFRQDSHLPHKGEIELSTSAALSMTQDRFENLVFHEFLHTMGFGGVWEFMGLVDDYDGDLRFNGVEATAAYNSEFAREARSDHLSHLGVPIETDGSIHTAGRHWDEATFDDEIMTGWLDQDLFLSDMTIAALSDMGYEVII